MPPWNVCRHLLTVVSHLSQVIYMSSYHHTTSMQCPEDRHQNSGHPEAECYEIPSLVQSSKFLPSSHQYTGPCLSQEFSLCPNLAKPKFFNLRTLASIVFWLLLLLLPLLLLPLSLLLSPLLSPLLFSSSLALPPLSPFMAWFSLDPSRCLWPYSPSYLQ